VRDENRLCRLRRRMLRLSVEVRPVRILSPEEAHSGA